MIGATSVTNVSKADVALKLAFYAIGTLKLTCRVVLPADLLRLSVARCEDAGGWDFDGSIVYGGPCLRRVAVAADGPA
ncbi:hypothetical protein RE428_31640 [Marinobacter nanhaiticus D15-8W]|nr:hypothetical protein RE428_31640 [Marinobacter nanhaiticus D15-8W]